MNKAEIYIDDRMDKIADSQNFKGRCTFVAKNYRDENYSTKYIDARALRQSVSSLKNAFYTGDFNTVVDEIDTLEQWTSHEK